MPFLGLRRLLAAALSLLLPALLVLTFLAFRLIEAWKLWSEMSTFSELGALAWMWAAAFFAAAVIVVGDFDTAENSRWWEFLIDLANTLSSIVLTLEAISEEVSIVTALPSEGRFLLVFAMCLTAQLTITFLGRRARGLARGLRHQMVLRTAPQTMQTGPVDHHNC